MSVETEIREFVRYVCKMSSGELSETRIRDTIYEEIEDAIENARKRGRISKSVKEAVSYNALANCRAWYSEPRLERIMLKDVAIRRKAWIVFHAISKKEEYK